jgi:2-oxoglutarate dehydrogenase E2 component (dihydrolipoamide succinyltransferase)
MPTKVIMPQMGESIAEGTITKWLKKVGDRVARDEPLFEISTDKVDAEIPSPAAGTLLSILAQEGQTVPVNAEVGLIGEATEAVAGPAPQPAPPSSRGAAPAKGAAAAAPAAASRPAPPASAGSAVSPARAQAPPPGASTVEERRRTRSSPVVRRIASEHQIDISRLSGTGISGRVTKRDILERVASGPSAAAAPASAPSGGAPGPRDFAGGATLREPMTVMRRKIAEHMVEARRIAAHVHTVFDVDLTEVGRLRQRHKQEWSERKGVNLTWLPFIQKAAIESLRNWPLLNASIDGTDIVYHRDVNLGIAVALDWGLIVPVIKRADELSLLGLARATTDLAERARTKKLQPDEVQGNTFTITNPGVFGGRFGTPIIPQPTVAILGVGTVEKRPVVRDDAIAIRTMCTLSLGFDHRLVDGAVADQFMAEIKRRLQEARFSDLA